MKDKIHFFGSYEGNYQNRANRVAIPASAAGIPGARHGESRAVQRALHIAVPREPVFRQDQRRRSTTSRTPRSASATVTRRTSATLAETRHVRGGGAILTTTTTSCRSSTTTSPGPWLNEAKVDYSRFHRGFSPELGSAHPRRLYLRHQRAITSIGAANSIQEFIQKRIGFRNDLTYTGFEAAGEHVFKGGSASTSPTYDINKDNDGVPAVRVSAQIRQHWQRRSDLQLHVPVPAALRHAAIRS